MTTKAIQIVILAAGGASRMGKPKQLLPIKDGLLLEKVIRTAIKQNTQGITCVLGANIDEIKPVLEPFPVDIAINEHWENGISSSIRTGVNHIKQKDPYTDAIMILLADQPEVDNEYLSIFIDHFKKGGTGIVAADYEGFYGVPALFSKNYFSLLKNLKGDSGAKELLNDSRHRVVGVSSHHKLQDIDTPADYELFLKSLNL